MSDNLIDDREFNYKLSLANFAIIDMETSKLVHQGAIIDSVFQPTDQVLSVQTQESANILSILGSQSTEPYLANHFDKLTDPAAAQGDAKMAKMPPAK